MLSGTLEVGAFAAGLGAHSFAVYVQDTYSEGQSGGITLSSSSPREYVDGLCDLYSDAGRAAAFADAYASSSSTSCAWLEGGDGFPGGCSRHLIDILEGERPTVTMTPTQTTPGGETRVLSLDTKATVAAGSGSQLVVSGAVAFDYAIGDAYYTTTISAKKQTGAGFVSAPILPDGSGEMPVALGA